MSSEKYLYKACYCTWHFCCIFFLFLFPTVLFLPANSISDHIFFTLLLNISLQIYSHKNKMHKNKMHPLSELHQISPPSDFVSVQCFPHKTAHSPAPPAVSYPFVFSFADLHVSTDLVFSSSAISIAHSHNFLSNSKLSYCSLHPIAHHVSSFSLLGKS